MGVSYIYISGTTAFDGYKQFSPFKRGGGHENFTLSSVGGGGAQQVLDPQFSHFVATPPHNY